MKNNKILTLSEVYENLANSHLALNTIFDNFIKNLSKDIVYDFGEYNFTMDSSNEYYLAVVEKVTKDGLFTNDDEWLDFESLNLDEKYQFTLELTTFNYED